MFALQIFKGENVEDNSLIRDCTLCPNIVTIFAIYATLKVTIYIRGGRFEAHSFLIFLVISSLKIFQYRCMY